MPPRQVLRGIPRSIWALGFVSMCMDISSEMVHSLLPIFMVASLGAGTLAVGLIEGIAEAAASITRVFSGTLSDHLGKRKALAVVGYGLAAVTKPVFPLAPSLGWVMTARFVDRVGKGIRGAPRDALVGDLAPPHLRGASFGLRQSLDTVGAFAGPLLAVLCMLLTGDDFRAVFWIAVVPAVAAVALLVLGVSEPERSAASRVAPRPLRIADFQAFEASFWAAVLVGSVLALARFSEAFLVLRARDVGLGVAWVPVVMVVMNVAYAASAYPFGVLSDVAPRRRVLGGGCLVLIAGDLLLAHGSSVGHVIVGVVLWGVHMGMTQGVFAALVTDAAPVRLRGTAFGIFNLTGGLATLVASVAAGALWQRFGAVATFDAGAGWAVLALVGLFVLKSRARPAPASR
jgi:MFS family permease